MEFVNGISLLSYLKSQPGKKLKESECIHIYSQILKGMSYLHDLNIVHRDLKLDNLIIDTISKSVKIIDYGFGCITTWSKELNFFCGTPSYMPPEKIQKKDYIGNIIYLSCKFIFKIKGFYADIWSLGILLFSLLCGSFPFRGNNHYLL